MLEAMTNALRLLVVDDESSNQLVATLILEHAGHEVVCCASAHEAIRLLLAPDERFDAVFMDVVMPVMDGLEAMRRLRAAPRTRDLPIVCVSAKAADRDMAEALAAGCDVYLTKPYQRQQLLEALDRSLGQRRLLGTQPQEDPPCPM